MSEDGVAVVSLAGNDRVILDAVGSAALVSRKRSDRPSASASKWIFGRQSSSGTPQSLALSTPFWRPLADGGWLVGGAEHQVLVKEGVQGIQWLGREQRPGGNGSFGSISDTPGLQTQRARPQLLGNVWQGLFQENCTDLMGYECVCKCA